MSFFLRLWHEVSKIPNPTMHFKLGNFNVLPSVIFSANECDVERIVRDNIYLSKTDWDSYETSWDFKRNPLI